MTVNLFGDHPSYAKYIKAMKFAFHTELCLPEVHEGNVVALAFKAAPSLAMPSLQERAIEIKNATKIPTKAWVKGLIPD